MRVRVSVRVSVNVSVSVNVNVPVTVNQDNDRGTHVADAGPELADFFETGPQQRGEEIGGDNFVHVEIGLFERHSAHLQEQRLARHPSHHLYVLSPEKFKPFTNSFPRLFVHLFFRGNLTHDNN